VGDEIYDAAFKKYSISEVYKFNNNNMFSIAFALSNFPATKDKKVGSGRHKLPFYLKLFPYSS